MNTLFGRKLVLGFTGTQAGMTKKQSKAFAAFVIELDPTHFHHGDCIGADAESHYLVREHAPKCKITIHPPIYDSKRAFCDGDFILQPKDYLPRNRDIVKAADRMVATPQTEQEILRSGTWSTIRASHKAGIDIILILPTGELRGYLVP